MARRRQVLMVCGPAIISEPWQAWLAATPGIQMGGVERSGEDALMRLAQDRPSHALVGCALTDMSGAAWIAQARQHEFVALVGSNNGQATCAEAMRQAGANAFVVVGPAGEGLVEALARTTPKTPFTLYVGEAHHVVRLPLQQYRVLRLISAGQQNMEIAFELGVTLKTVERHVAALYQALGVGNRAEAVGWAIRRSLDR